MSALDKALTQAKAGRVKSILVSGGCGPGGNVPWRQFLPQLRELSRYSRLNFHTGLVDEGDAQALSQVASAVSLDLVGDQETVQEVYGLSLPQQAWFDSYLHLKGRVPVIPHICVGLKGGQLSGEEHCLEFLAAQQPDTATLIVFIPTSGTAYAQHKAPSLAEVARIFSLARLMLPKTKLNLGCMRPPGRYRAQLDVLAMELGFNGIVQPTGPAVKLAQELGLSILEGRECCSL
jgi:uncharacterized radical SAM superfamily protein